MSIDDDVALLERVPTLRVLGTASLRMLAIGSEQRNLARDSVLFHAGDEADGGFIVQRGQFRIEDGGATVVAGPGDLIGELALINATRRPSTATAIEDFIGDSRRPQPVPAGAGKRSGCGTAAARRICESAQARSPATFSWRAASSRPEASGRSRQELKVERDRHGNVVGRPLPASRIAGDPVIVHAIFQGA